MSFLNRVDWVIIIMLVTAFIGFSLGYKRGLCKGRLVGEIEGVIKLREKSLYLGKCGLCGKGQDDLINIQKHVCSENEGRITL